ncbi:hypothetical protein ASG92_16915 [Arthrobacter sp. Soil736]|nr:hypothetical protein ASG92_16915 [Arthrobacter sp. Soil736]
MRPLSLVELQRLRQCVQDALGNAAEFALFESGVVLGTHTGQGSDLAAAQPGNAAVPAVVRQTGLLRGDPGPPRRQELANLLPIVQAINVRDRPAIEADPASGTYSRVSLTALKSC